MKKTSIILIISLFFSIQLQSQQNWTNYTNHGNIYDVLIDGDDMWIGSQGGLIRNNKVKGEFGTYVAGNSPIKGGGIREIEKAPDGSLWLGSENAGLFNLKDGEWTHYYEGIIIEKNRYISNLEILPNGDVWFFVNAGNDYQNRLLRIRNGEVKEFYNLPNEQTAFHAADENTIYLTYNHVIAKYDVLIGDVVEYYHSSNSIITMADNFRDILTDKNGVLILPSKERVLQLKDGVISEISNIGLWTYRSFSDDIGNIYFQPYLDELNDIVLMKYDGENVTYIKREDLGPYPVDDTPRIYAADSEGNLIGSLYDDNSEYYLYEYDGSIWNPIQSQIYPIQNYSQDNVQADCDGNLWFNKRHGVAVRYTDGTWQDFRVEEASNRYFKYSNMAVDPTTCDVWFANNSNGGGTSTPGIIRIKNGNVTEFLHGYDNIYGITAPGENKVYFYSIKLGFGYIENNEVVFIDEFEQYESIYDIEKDSKGNIYLAARNFGLIKYNGESFAYLGSGDGNDMVYQVMVDNDDFIWVTTGTGLMKFDGINWTSYNDLWPNGIVNGLTQDNRGNYWISTWNDGLYYWDGGMFTQNYNILNSDLTTDRLRSVNLDPAGNLIVSQNVGASVLEIPNLQRTYKGTGKVFYDENLDGNYVEPEDIFVPGQKVMDITNDTWAITNSSGEYRFYNNTLSSNTYTHELDDNAESTTEIFQVGDLFTDDSQLPDFGFWKDYVTDVQMTISNGVPVCNREFIVHINLFNKSAESVSGTFTLNYSSILEYIECSVPISNQSDGLITIEDFALESFGARSIKITFETPGITVLETALAFDAVFDSDDKQVTASTTDIILCSYDPNDKKVEPTGDFINDFSLIEDELKYTIRFQNEGTYKAFDITILDTLTNALDPSTFEFLASSHRVETSITADGIVTFFFPDIDLPFKDEDDLGSQGFVSFTVRPKADTPNFEKIENTASIYFDFNPPIVTNTTTWNVVDDLALLSINEINSMISIYPNPTNGNIKVDIDRKLDFEVYNVNGYLIQEGVIDFGINDIHINCKPGIYILKLNDRGDMVTSKKLVVF